MDKKGRYNWKYEFFDDDGLYSSWYAREQWTEKERYAHRNNGSTLIPAPIRLPSDRTTFKNRELELRKDVIKLGDLIKKHNHRNKSILLAFKRSMEEWREFIGNPSATYEEANWIAEDEADALKAAEGIRIKNPGPGRVSPSR